MTEPTVTTETPACNLCGSERRRELYRAQDYRFRIDDLEWPVVSCEACGLGYLCPRPTLDVIGKYYEAKYYEGRDLGEIKRRHAFELTYLDGLRPGRLLEIGAASGEWMRLAKARGWDVTGIERGVPSSEEPGFRLINSTFPDADLLPTGSFDLVTAWAVVEHLHDPMAAFKRIGALLKPGGHFILLVPNLNSVASRYAYAEDLPRHLYFFTENTLRGFGNEAGLTLKKLDHVPQFFKGTGRGALLIRALRPFGLTVSDVARLQNLSRKERFAESKAIAALYTAFALADRMVFTETLARLTKSAGHVVGVYQKPLAS